MKKRKLLHSILMLLCVAFIVALPVGVKAKEITDEEPIYYDTEQGRFVNDLDEYLSQLNAGVITPYAPTIEEHEPEITLHDGIISDPSKECSNIFGHKWGDWTNWEEYKTVHRPSGPCALMIKRWRYCERTHCGASQTETDVLHITSCHGNGN